LPQLFSRTKVSNFYRFSPVKISLFLTVQQLEITYAANGVANCFPAKLDNAVVLEDVRALILRLIFLFGKFSLLFDV
jgi:hypothetical protein